jgi:hypothetical protein
MPCEINEEEFLKHRSKNRSAIKIAELLNVSYCDLALWMIEHNYKLNFTRANVPFEKKIATLWNAGYTDRELADAMGVNRDTITGWRYRRKLSPNKKKSTETIK